MYTTDQSDSTATTGAVTISLSRPPTQENERYVGAIVRPDLTGYHLIRMPLDLDLEMKWKAAMAFAAKQGGELPNRTESALLFETREEGEFESDWYWTREQHAGIVDFAWCQFVGDGCQGYGHKSSQYRVVLVRRVPFTYSVIQEAQ